MSVDLVWFIFFFFDPALEDSNAEPTQSQGATVKRVSTTLASERWEQRGVSKQLESYHGSHEKEQTRDTEKLSSPFYVLFQMYTLEIDGSKKKEYMQLIIYEKWEGDETGHKKFYLLYSGSKTLTSKTSSRSF